VTALRTGAVVWEGRSRLTGDPIVVLVTWRSRNGGTGDMAQSWILRSDQHPIDAIRTGADTAVCPESCTLRLRASRDAEGPQARCYAAGGLTVRALSGLYARLGDYPRMTPEQAGMRLAGARLRIGAYGDPAAVPVSVWVALTAHTAGHTGYTHAADRAPLLRSLVMASADSAEQAARLQASGWRTYRVRHVGAGGEVERLLAGEVVCPKSAEGGERATCDRCLLCDGTGGRSQRSIAVVDHWSGAVRLRRQSGDLQAEGRLLALRRSREGAELRAGA